jgi:hypothetical protein
VSLSLLGTSLDSLFPSKGHDGSLRCLSRDSGEFDDNHYGYPTSPRGSVSQGSEQQQRYHPVQIR